MSSKHLFASTQAWIIQLVNSKSEITYKLLPLIYFFTSRSLIHKPEREKYVLDFSERGRENVNISIIMQKKAQQKKDKMIYT